MPRIRRGQAYAVDCPTPGKSKLMPLLVAPTEAGVPDQLPSGLLRGEVHLHQAAQEWVLDPCRVGEAAVPAGRRDGRGAGADLGQLGDQVAQQPAGRTGVSGDAYGEPGGRRIGGEFAHWPERGVDEQRVQRGRLVGDVLGHRGRHGRGHQSRWSSGGTIARLRILPVGPFGSSPTIQSLRGYLYAATWLLT